MNSTLPHLPDSSRSRYLAKVSSSSPKILVSGICRTGVRQIPRGFSLIEIAIALFIITLLLGSLLVPLQTQVVQRQVSDTQKALEEITEALLGFAVAKGYLPCPDLTSGGAGAKYSNDYANDGVEDFSGGNCTNFEGNVPWVTLGVGGADPWGNRYRYRVDPDFTNRTTPFTLSSAADLRMCATSACTTELTVTTAGNKAVAIILSHGKNGYGGINSDTGAANTAPVSVDEQSNSDIDTTFVSHTITPVGATAGEFDDIVIWLGKYMLFNRMVAAGKLP